MFVVSFLNFKSSALSHDPSGDTLMPHARAKASHENITF